MLSNDDRQEIIDTARTWLGTPFRHQGRNSSGLDCAGLVLVTAKAVNRCPPEFDDRNYARLPRPDRMKAVLDSNMDRISRADANNGDVVYMTNYLVPQHLAILTDIGLIHAFEEIGKVVEHEFDELWSRDSRIVAVYRLREVNWWQG